MIELLFGSALSFFLIILFLFCWPAAYIAGQKNRCMITWFFAGMLFGPMAVLMVGFSPVLPTTSNATDTPRPVPQTVPPADHSANFSNVQPSSAQADPSTTPQPSLFCRRCGEALGSDDVFCQSCGCKTC